MTTLFHINFRREAYLRELARTRRRVVVIGIWVGYFGILAVLLGLYGLNCAELSRRVRLLERQSARISSSTGPQTEWNLKPGETARVERFLLNPRRWRDRLSRLATILPPNVRITSLHVNPSEGSTPTAENTLVITGEVRMGGEDRMQSIMHVIQTLHRDSVFASSYRNIRLGSTRVSDGVEGSAQFTIECR